MRIYYKKAIKEDEDELVRLERRLRGSQQADRIKMLRLLKSSHYTSRIQLAPVIGYSERQLQRWWNTYQEGGIEALLEDKPVGGSDERITPEARQSIEAEIRAGRVTRLRHVQQYLKDRFDIEYRSLQGISDLLRRHEISLKREKRPENAPA